MSNILELDHLTKHYGAARGVDDVSLKVEQGAIFGFLGPNGAGKTTTISMLVDLIRPTSGHVKIFGLDSRKDGLAIRKRIGFLAGDFALDEKLTGWQQLTYFGNLHGSIPKTRIKELAERLGSDLNRPIKTLSRGNRQKIGLISALMHDPELLIFDEPTTGLDPLVQAEFNKIILENKQKGNTTFISSHLLSEVQEICEEVAFIREGKLLAQESMQSLAARSPKRIHIVNPDQKLTQALHNLKGINVLPSAEHNLKATFMGDVNDLLHVLSKHKIKDATIQEADLETIFMQYYQDQQDVSPASEQSPEHRDTFGASDDFSLRSSQAVPSAQHAPVLKKKSSAASKPDGLERKKDA